MRCSRRRRRGPSAGSSCRIARVDSPVHVAAPRTSRAGSTSSSSRAGSASCERPAARGAVPRHPLVRRARERAGAAVGRVPSAATRSNRRFYVDYTDRDGNTRVVEYRSRGRPGKPVRTRRQIFFLASPTRTTTAASSHSGRTAPVRRDGRRGLRRRSGEPRAEPAIAARQAHPHQRQPAKPQPVIAGYGAAQPVALLVRPADRRPVHRRRRPERVGGDRLHAAAQPGARELRLGRLRGQARYSAKRDAEPAGRLVLPYVVLPNPPNCSVTGGFVYRGSAVPSAKGRYFFSDNCAGRVRAWLHAGARRCATSRSASTGAHRSARTLRGELYIASIYSGNVYKLAQ